MEKIYNALALAIIFSFIGFFDVDGQPLRNLNFEKPGIIDQTRPLDWNIFPVGYKISRDSTKSQNGLYSLMSKRLPDFEHGSSFSRLQIPAELIRGKKINLSGWIRTKDIQDGFAIIWLDIVDNEGNFSRVSLPEGGVTGTTNWQRFKEELHVETTAESAFISLFHTGSGTSWFDNFDILIDGVEYNPDMFDPWMASKEEIKWLEDNAIPLHTDAPGSGFDDLNALQELFNGAKIIGLGEATHGTREFFRMKHRFVEWFAQQADTTIFVIEASMPEARIVNEYVLYGKGDPKEALAGMHFWVWNSQEVLDLIEWMRDYNLSGEGRVEFWGNDLQFPLLAADSVEVFIEKADPDFLDQLNDHYVTIRQTEDEELRRMSQDQLREMYQEVSNVRNHIELNKSNYLTIVDKMSVEWAIQNARIVEQVITRLMHDEDSRDRSMALNTEWIYNHRVSNNSNMVIWAHNMHVWHNEGWMGYYLVEMFGDLYRSVGFGFGEGKYTAVTGLEVPVNSYPTPPVQKGSIEYTLGSINLPIYALDLRNVSKHDHGKWLSEPKHFKNIGSGALEDPYSIARIAEEYDVLIYFDQTTSSHSFGRP